MLKILDAHWDWIRHHFPEENIPDERLGRKRCLRGGRSMRCYGCSRPAIVNRAGLPLSVITHAVNHDEVKLEQLSFDFHMIEAMPAVSIGDRAYDSHDLDDKMRGKGVKMVSPHRQNRKTPKTQDERNYIVTSGFGSWSGSSRG